MYLLNHSATIHLKAKCQHMTSELISQFSNLRCCPMLEKLKMKAIEIDTEVNYAVPHVLSDIESIITIAKGVNRMNTFWIT